MRILFVFLDPGRIRYFEGPLEELARRGHEVHALLEKPRERIPGQLRFIEELSARFPGVTYGGAPKRTADGWTALARELRLGLDHLHYLKPRFDGSPHFRERSANDAPSRVVRLARRSVPGRAIVGAALRRAERAIPPDPRVVEEVAARGPDVLLVTPYVWFGATQTDWVRAARALGVRTGACVFSWDNLTSKGSMREVPDLVTVWNETQRREAAELHGVPPSRVAVTGAQSFDHWFSWAPSTTRAEFLQRAGLPADRPLVVYLGSSGFVGPEREHFERWLSALRSSAGAGTDASVLVRPHPQTVGDEWLDAVAGKDRVVVWPPRGEVPMDDDSRSRFFDTLCHADAVVGVNTSAFIEAAILDKPCLTLLTDEFRRGQVETLHFHHLLEQSGGPVRAATRLEQHVAQLGEALERGGGERGREFVERFVRAGGAAGAERLADAVEALGAQTRSARMPGLGDRLVRRLLAGAAVAAEQRAVAARDAKEPKPRPPKAKEPAKEAA